MGSDHHRIIFFGDTHGYWDDFAKQKEIIERFKPEFVISEQLQDQVLDSPKAYRDFQDMIIYSAFVRHDEVTKLVDLCEKKAIALIGLDLHDFGFDESLYDVISGITAPTPEQEQRLDEILTRRQAHQVSVIKHTLSRTTKPIVVLVGAWHLQEGMPLRTSFPDALIIYPCDEKGALLIEPPTQTLPARYRTFPTSSQDDGCDH